MPSFSVLPPLSLYVHLPWCIQKCPYCDFNSHAAKGNIPETLYVNALLQEVEDYLDLVQGRPLISIFFGGGTPSLFSGKAIGTILEGVHKKIEFTKEVEITLEANPGTVDKKNFLAFYQAGINRLSLGVQSMQEVQLKRLGRIHDTSQVITAIETAKQVGFKNFNVDIMYGLPEQTVGEALQDLITALSFESPHLSWYQLTIEPNTLFYKQTPPLPAEDLIVDMQLAGQALLVNAGLQQYEVSAYAKTNKHCLHNRNYWEFGDYLGLGAGAHSKITQHTAGDIVRFAQVKHPKDYLNSEKRRMPEQRFLNKEDKIFEFMLNALRLTAGVPVTLFTERTGLSLEDIAPLVNKAIERGLLANDASQLRPTTLGQQFLNDLVAMFLKG